MCTDSLTGVKCVCPSCSHSGIKVCGSDGKTYRDVCALKKYSCEKNSIIEVVSRSECNASKIEYNKARINYGFPIRLKSERQR